MAQNIIELSHVSYQYSGSHQLALQDVSLNLRKGRWLSIVGRNGSGKSTLIKLIDGLLPLKCGKVTVAGLSLNSQNAWRIRSKIGFVFQNPDDQFVFPTVKDDVAFGLENRRVPSSKMDFMVNNALAQVGMLKFKNSLIGDLSGGQKQRVAIAGLIIMRPAVMIFDESTSMLDSVARYQILHLTAKLQCTLGLTIIMVTHDFYELKFSNQVMMMNHGRIVLNEPKKQFFTRTDLPSLGISSLIHLMRVKHLPIPNSVNNETRLLNWLLQFL